MLPRLDRLSLKPTGEFYALTPGEVTEEGEDPIHGHFYHPGQTKDSLVATFRVRSKDPRPGTKNQYVYHIFDAGSLWEWVKREDHAYNPKNRDPLWKEDWLALHEKFDPGSPVPDWVRNLPQLDPNFVDGMPTVQVPKWAEDLQAAFSLSSDFVEDTHGDTPIEQAITGLVQALRRIKNGWTEEPAEYRDNIRTYNNNPYHDVQWNPANGDPPPSLTDVIDNLLVCVVQYRTMPLRVRTAAIGFVASFLRHPGIYLQKVADYVINEDYVDHDDLREALDQYILAITNATDMQPLVRHVTRLQALRLRHHTFWKWPILDRHLKGPPPSAKITAPALTGYADALMILLKEKVEAATNEMGHFTHKEDDVEGFFQLDDDYAHYWKKIPADVATKHLSEIRDLFRKTRTYTEEDDGRQRALTITFFANVLNVFVELWMWNDADDTLLSDHWGSDVQDWAEKLASTLKSVLRYEDSVSTESNAVTTFFWWYVAPLYEAGTVSNQIKAHYFPPHVIERHDVLKGLSLLDDTVARLPADPPAAHERPSGEATPGRRRQRTEA